jgi:hypothetical protein
MNILEYLKALIAAIILVIIASWAYGLDNPKGTIKQLTIVFKSLLG